MILVLIFLIIVDSENLRVAKIAFFIVGWFFEKKFAACNVFEVSCDRVLGRIF